MTFAQRHYDDEAPVGPWSDALVPLRPDVASTQAFTSQQGAWRPFVRNRLRSLASYSVGWDGYDGMSPRPDVVAFAWHVVSSVMSDSAPLPQIVPLSDGSLQIEWHTRKLHLEVHVAAPYSVSLDVELPADGLEDEHHLVANFSLIQQFLLKA
jgi:hypothetical protein